MHPAFQPFTEETRRRVAETFAADPDSLQRDQEVHVTAQDGDTLREGSIHCCPIGMCLLFDGYIEPFIPGHHDKVYASEIIGYRNREGKRTFPVAPAAVSIIDAIHAVDPDAKLGVGMFRTFYIKWDVGIITRKDLPGFLGVEEVSS